MGEFSGGPSGKCPVEFSSLGRWWGSDPKERVGLSVLETLVKRSSLFPYQKKRFYLFAKSGFTKGCVDRAKEMGNVVLVSYREIVGRCSCQAVESPDESAE